jgi:hypothetical protein
MSITDGPISFPLAEGGWLVILLVAPGLLALAAVVVAFLFRPGRATAEGPGYYHVMGIEQSSGRPHDMTIHAGSAAAARGRAEFEGIIVTEVRRVEGESSSSES